MREYTCCFTGHRKIPKNEYAKIEKDLKKEIIKLINKGVRYFGAGGAIGFDTLAAMTIIKLKKKHPQIRLILVLPCKNQTRFWSKKDIEIYNFISDRADKTVYTASEYQSGCMEKRNRHLVDNSKYCLCYLNSTVGGTAYTVNYARKNGLNIINIAEINESPLHIPI